MPASRVIGSAVRRPEDPRLLAGGGRYLHDDRARYAGQPLAAVVADSRYLAEDAVDAITVATEPLPAVVDVDAAVAPDAPRLYDEWPDNVVASREIAAGDVDAALAAAHVTVEATFDLPRHAGMPLEGRGAVASFDRMTGRLTVWVSHQAPHQYRTILVQMLAVDEHSIHLIVPDVGGGFGVKLHHYPEEILACVAAMRLGRPVKWMRKA
jgi:carbon-monoxide dehydrogenase large subunit